MKINPIKQVKHYLKYSRFWIFLLILAFSMGYFLLPRFTSGFFHEIFQQWSLVCFLLIVLDTGMIYARSNTPGAFLKGNIHEFAFFILMMTYWEESFSLVQLIWIRQMIVILKVVLTSKIFSAIFKETYKNPAKLMLISFGSAIILGGLLLSLPIASSSGEGFYLVDSMFTSASAVCVTGLIVKDTPVDFSFFGQIIILLMIQLGGLGIMTISTFLTLLIGRKLGVRERVTIEALISEEGLLDIVKVLKFIIKMTVIIETLGALILSVRFYILFENVSKAIYFGIFHSISAFCNAGFALFSNSFEGFFNDGVIVFTITTLIHLGSLGFTVIYAMIASRFWLGREKWKKYRFSIHFKLAVTMTLLLTFGGMFFILFTEYTNLFLDYTFGEKLLASYFQSVTLRTAGFNTVNFGNLQNATLIFMFIAMFIGACPGSTGGGVKTTTVGVMGLTVISMLRSRKNVEYKMRRIPQRIVNEAIAIVTISFIIVGVFSTLLCITEEFSMREIVFETISAFATVGLSLGITAKLSSVGKILITILMFIGRVGPLTVAFALGQDKDVENYRLMKGNIVVG